jgi:transglutaminase-like putative cysteine protease
MKNFLFSLTILLLSQTTLQAQVASYALPDALKKHANAIVQNEEGVFEVISAGKAKYVCRKTVTILNQNGDEYANLYLSYDKFSKISNISGTLYDAKGKEIRSLKKDDIRDYSSYDGVTFFSDNRVKYVTFNHHTYPYTVTYEYEETQTNLMGYPTWNAQGGRDLSVIQSDFKVTMPANLKLRYNPKNTEIQPVITHPSDKTTYHWSFANLPAFRKEELLPSGTYDRPIIETAPTEFEVDGYKGNMNSWASFSKFDYELNDKRDDLNIALQQQLKEMVKTCETDSCKIARVYDYLQKNTRYVGVQLGIGGWQTIKADDVDRNKYGDCKALTNYTKAMLKYVGIKAVPVLVTAGEGKVEKRDFISGHFNHIFLSIPTEKDTIYLECTDQSGSMNYLGGWTDDRDVLQCLPSGGKLIHTPSYTQEDNQEIRITTINLDPEGNAKINATTRYTAISGNNRARLTQQPKEKQEKQLLEELKIAGITLTDFSLDLQKGRIPLVTEKLNFQVEHCAAKTGKRLFLAPNLLNKQTWFPKDEETRTSPIQLSYFAKTEKDEVTINIPTGYKLESIPTPTDIHSDFGDFKTTFEQTTTTVTYKRIMVFNKSIQPKEKYQEIIDFLKKIVKADSAKLVFVAQ